MFFGGGAITNIYFKAPAKKAIQGFLGFLVEADLATKKENKKKA